MPAIDIVCQTIQLLALMPRKNQTCSVVPRSSCGASANRDRNIAKLMSTMK